MRYPRTCVRSRACQPTKGNVAASGGAVRGDAMGNAGETFNFSSKNFSCSLRRPECIAQSATRRGEIKIHAATRLFSAVCLAGSVGRSAGRSARDEEHGRPYIVARVPARRKKGRLGIPREEVWG